MTTNKKIYLGVDPGKDKTGVALVEADTSSAGEVFMSSPKVSREPQLQLRAHRLCRGWRGTAAGGGGASRRDVRTSSQQDDGVSVISVRPEGAGDHPKDGGGASQRDPKIIAETILPTRNFVSHLKTFLSSTPLTAIVMGNGTTSQKMQQQLEKAFPQLPFHVVNEYNTTQEAKKLYWKLHPPTGWKKLFPTALFDPPSPVDGLAAAVQVFRYLCDKNGKSS